MKKKAANKAQRDKEKAAAAQKRKERAEAAKAKKEAEEARRDAVLAKAKQEEGSNPLPLSFIICLTGRKSLLFPQNSFEKKY